MTHAPAPWRAPYPARSARHADELAAFHEIAHGLIDRLDVEGVLETILERAAALMGTSDAYLYLPEGNDLVVRFGLGQFAPQVGYRLGRGSGLAGRVFKTGEPLAVDDYHAWTGRRRDLDGRPFHAVVGVPLRAGAQVVGVIGLAYAEPGRRFGPAEVELLARFGDLASLALENARLFTASAEGEERYRSLVANIPGAIYRAEFDGSWRIDYMSEAIVQLSGYEARDFFEGRRSITSLIHPDDADATIAVFDEAVRTKAPYSLEYRIVHRDGSVRWVLERSRAMPGADGRISLDGSLFDVSDQRRADERVRAAEARYRLLVEQLPLVTYVHALRLGEGNLYVSPQVEDILGTPVEEWLSDDLLANVVHPEDRERVVAAAAQLREAGEPFHEEYRIVRPDGRIVWVLDETRVVAGASGEPEYVQGFMVDITERREAHETRARLAAVVESSADAIFSTAMDGTITSWNAGAERMYGYRPEEVVGRPVSTLIPPERGFEERAILEHVRDGETIRELDTVRIRKDGERLQVSVTVSPITDARGEIVGASAVQRDITERVRLAAERERLLESEREAREAAEAAQRELAAQNERLRELDRLKDEFIALVSHELRTPLTSIRGYIDLILDDESLTPEQRKFLEIADRNSDRLLRLVGDLLFLAQLEAGSLELAPTPVDLVTVAKDGVAAAQPAAEAKEITLELVADESIAFDADGARLGQVVDNLVSNAIKFTPAGGSVGVRVRKEDGAAVLEVSDSGIGIPEAEQAYLFDRFFRTAEATDRAIPGTGLGLTISKALVEAHEGSISFVSTEGEGTTFRVVLPLAPAAAPERVALAS